MARSDFEAKVQFAEHRGPDMVFRLIR
jgi:hypothetical protein